MKNKSNNSVKCQICGKENPPRDVLPAEMVRNSVANTIKKEHPKWSSDGYICHDDLNKYRIEHVQDVLETERGELSHLDHEVVKSMRKHEVMATNINAEFDQKMNFGQRVADRVTKFVGSWTFIISFCITLVLWIIVNAGLCVKSQFWHLNLRALSQPHASKKEIAMGIFAIVLSIYMRADAKT